MIYRSVEKIDTTEVIPYIYDQLIYQKGSIHIVEKRQNLHKCYWQTGQLHVKQ